MCSAHTLALLTQHRVPLPDDEISAIIGKLTELTYWLAPGENGSALRTAIHESHREWELYLHSREFERWQEWIADDPEALRRIDWEEPGAHPIVDGKLDILLSPEGNVASGMLQGDRQAGELSVAAAAR